MGNIKTTVRKLQQLKREIPKIAANEMVNFALDNIRAGSWEGQPYQPRDPRAERNAGRRILVDTGEGRRSIAAKTGQSSATLTANEYMLAHNTGVRKRVNVRAHSRRRNGHTESVSSFTRNMNLPKRQFTGKSKTQTRHIQKVVFNRIAKAFS